MDDWTMREAAPRAEASTVSAVPIAAVAPALSKSSPLHARKRSIARRTRSDHKKRPSTPQGAKQPLPETGATAESGGPQPLCHPNSPDSALHSADAQHPVHRENRFAEEQTRAYEKVSDERTGTRGTKQPKRSAEEDTVNNSRDAPAGSAVPDGNFLRLRRRRKRESKGGGKPHKKKNRGQPAQALRATRKRPCRAIGLCCRMVLAFASFCIGVFLVLAPLAAFAPGSRARAGAVVERGQDGSSLPAATLASFSPLLAWARQVQDLAVEALQTGSLPASWASRELDQRRQHPVGVSHGGMWGLDESSSLSVTGYREDDEDEDFEPSALAKFQDGVVQWLKSVAKDGQTSKVDAGSAPKQRSSMTSQGSPHGRAPKRPVVASARDLFTGLTARLSKLYEDVAQHEASMAGPTSPRDSSAIRTAVEQQRAATILPRLVVQPGTRLGRVKSMLDGNGPTFDATIPWVTPSED